MASTLHPPVSGFTLTIDWERICPAPASSPVSPGPHSDSRSPQSLQAWRLQSPPYWPSSWPVERTSLPRETRPPWGIYHHRQRPLLSQSSPASQHQPDPRPHSLHLRTATHSACALKIGSTGCLLIAAVSLVRSPEIDGSRGPVTWFPQPV